MRCYVCGKTVTAENKYICPYCGADNSISAELVEKASAGDQAAFTRLYVLTENEVRTMVKTVVKSVDDADDIVQKTYLKALEQLPALYDPSAVRSWLKRIAHNEAIDHLRKNRELTFSDIEREDTEDERKWDPEDDRHIYWNPEQTMDQKEASRLLMEILDSIPDDQSKSLTLYYFHDMSIKEIAEFYGVSENTIKSRMSMAKKKTAEKIRALERRGTKLYGYSGVSFLIFLYKCACMGEGDDKAAAAFHLGDGVLLSSEGSAQAAAQAAGAAASGKAFMTATKIITAAAGIVLVGILLMTALRTESILIEEQDDSQNNLFEVSRLTTVEEISSERLLKNPERETISRESDTASSEETSIIVRDETVLDAIVETEKTSEPGSGSETDSLSSEAGSSGSEAESSSDMRGEPSSATSESSSTEESEETTHSTAVEDSESEEVTESETEETTEGKTEEVTESESEEETESETEETTEGETEEVTESESEEETESETEETTESESEEVTESETEETTESETEEVTESESEEETTEAEDPIVASGTCGADASWKLTGSSLEGLALTIEGSGDIYYYNNGGPWSDYREDITSLEIGEGITTIGHRAFYNCTSLASVKLPESLQVLESDAFEGTGISGITLPAKLKEIKAQAFTYCKNLKSISIPDGVDLSGMNIFLNCSSLTSVRLPSDLKIVPAGIFSGCKKLTSISIPAGVTTIGRTAFEATGLKTVTLSENITSIGEYAFLNCYDLETIIYQGSESAWNKISIGDEAIPSGTEIRYLKEDPETEPDGPSLVASGSCGSSAEWTLMSDDTGYYSLKIQGSGAMTSYTTYSISDTEYHTSAPWDQYHLLINSLEIQDGITEIGDYAFYEMTRLTSVSIPASVKSIGIEAFSLCSSLSSISLNEGLRIIGAGAFCRTTITSINLPESLTTIGQGAFGECKKLKAVTIPSGVAIGYTAFSSCYALERAVLPADLTELPGSLFSACPSLTECQIPSGVTSIGDYAFSGCSISEFTIPSGVTYIGERALYSYTTPEKLFYEGTESQWNRIDFGDHAIPDFTEVVYSQE